MAHVGEEFAFGSIGPFGFLLGHFKESLGLLPPRDVGSVKVRVTGFGNRHSHKSEDPVIEDLLELQTFSGREGLVQDRLPFVGHNVAHLDAHWRQQNLPGLVRIDDLSILTQADDRGGTLGRDPGQLLVLLQGALQVAVRGENFVLQVLHGARGGERIGTSPQQYGQQTEGNFLTGLSFLLKQAAENTHHVAGDAQGVEHSPVICGRVLGLEKDRGALAQGPRELPRTDLGLHQLIQILALVRRPTIVEFEIKIRRIHQIIGRHLKQVQAR